MCLCFKCNILIFYYPTTTTPKTMYYLGKFYQLDLFWSYINKVTTTNNNIKNKLIYLRFYSFKYLLLTTREFLFLTWFHCFAGIDFSKINKWLKLLTWLAKDPLLLSYSNHFYKYLLLAQNLQFWLLLVGDQRRKLDSCGKRDLDAQNASPLSNGSLLPHQHRSTRDPVK